MQLKKKIMSDRYNSFLFKKYKGNILLVGGYIRDLVRGIDSKDRDYIVKEKIDKIVNEICNYTKGTLIKFKKGDMYRIVTTDGYILDFSKKIGSIREDLSKRDFTINALAWSPELGIVDLFNGINDIKTKTIRSISKRNFINDPLRIIRAYRFAAELNGTIEYKTKKQIKALKTKVKKVSTERITLELFNLLNHPDSSRYLKMLNKDSILSQIIYIKNNILEKNIRAIYKLERGTFRELSHKIKALLKQNFSQNLTYKGLLCLEQIMQHIEKYDYISNNLCLSNKIKKRIFKAFNGIKEIDNSRNKIKEALFEIFSKSNDASIDALILSNKVILIKEYKRYQRIMRRGILSSEEIIDTLGTVKGAMISSAINMVKKAQFYREIKNKKQAIYLLKEKSGKK